MGWSAAVKFMGAVRSSKSFFDSGEGGGKGSAQEERVCCAEGEERKLLMQVRALAEGGVVEVMRVKIERHDL